jgi:hypothetical protein
VNENAIFYHVFSFESLVKEPGVTEGQVRNLDFSQNIMVGVFEKVPESFDVFDQSMALKVSGIRFYSIKKHRSKSFGWFDPCGPEILSHYGGGGPVLGAHVNEVRVYCFILRMVIDYRRIMKLTEKIIMSGLAVSQDEFVELVRIYFIQEQQREAQESDHRQVVKPSNRPDDSDGSRCRFMPKESFYRKGRTDGVRVGVDDDQDGIPGGELRKELMKLGFPGLSFDSMNLVSEQGVIHNLEV